MKHLIQRITALAVGAALIAAPVVIASPALADETVDETTVTQVVEETPAAAEEVAAPAETPAAPVVEQAAEPAPAAPAPAPEQAKAAEPVAQSPPAEAKTNTDEPKKVYVCKYVGKPGVDERLKEGKNPIEVSVNSLKDFPGTFPWAFADAQDHSVAIGFVGGPVLTVDDCPEAEGPPEVKPLACVPAGVWYTEGDDIPPVPTATGLLFQDATSKAVGYRVPVTGNLQGWTSVSFVNDGGQDQFFFRIVVDLSADGGPAYKSLSFPGASTITQSSVAYQYGKTIAELAVLFPNNVIKSVGFQTNSAAPADYAAVLKSVTGPCATVNFVPTPPPTYTPSCVEVTGSQTIVGDGVLTVAGDWASTTVDVPFSGKLKDIGAGNTLDVTASNTQYLGLHVKLADGRVIVFEEEGSYAGKLWSESAFDGVDAGMGYAAFGSAEEFILLNGNLDVASVKLLYTHPNASTTTVTSFTIGCTLYTFKPAVVEPPVDPPVVDPPVVTPPAVTPPAETPKATPTVIVQDELAATGSEGVNALAVGGIALGVIAAGLAVLYWVRRYRAIHSEPSE